MGIPLEESVLQLVPVVAAMLTAVAITGRTTLVRLRRASLRSSRWKHDPPCDDG